MPSPLCMLSWLVPSLAHHVQPLSRGAICTRGVRGCKTRRAMHSTRIASASTSSPDHTGQRQHPPSPDKEQVTTQTFNTANGRIKIDLSNKSLIGTHQSRGERPYQEDTFAIRSIALPGDEIGRTLRNGAPSGPPIADKSRGSQGSSNTDVSTSAASGGGSSTTSDKETDISETTLYCAVFDGHNGSQVSTFLSAHLHQKLLTVNPGEANDIVSSYRALGGYMRRYKGGLLSNLVDPPAPRRANKIARELKVEEERLARLDRGEADPRDMKENIQDIVRKDTMDTKQPKKPHKPWNVLQRIEAAFLKTDLEIIKTEQEAGSTATVALLHSLDEPRNPFFASKELHLILAHCGDTRALLCTVSDGTAIRMTETHHPEARSETDRLMRIRTGAVTDSFGESRWAGSLANTRAFGDAHYKALGVFSEPQLVSQVIQGPEYAFLILLSDGVTEVLSDQEICDLASRDYTNPTHAARSVISFAESVGAQDNLTCLILPLAGWGKVGGSDSTKARRELRLSNYEGRSNRQNRM